MVSRSPSVRPSIQGLITSVRLGLHNDHSPLVEAAGADTLVLLSPRRLPANVCPVLLATCILTAATGNRMAVQLAKKLLFIKHNLKYV